jgi:maltose O-acetyltransferase
MHGGAIVWPRESHSVVPVRADGRGKVELENGVNLGSFEAPRIGDGAIQLRAALPNSRITIGAGTATSNNITIIAMKSVVIGTRCLIGDCVTVYDCDFHEIDPAHRSRSFGPIEQVTIGDNVWLGSRVIVLKGVSIGDNSVVAAGSVVTRSLPANVVAAGVPARVIKQLPSAGSVVVSVDP